jgi:phage-related protein
VSEFDFEVEFFKDKNGKEPIKDFINELLEKAKTNKKDKIRAKKVLAYIEALERWGTRAGFPYTKHIDGDIWELRPLKDRIFFFFWKENTFVLVHHFIKKTQKTPKKEIKRAIKNMLEHLERSGNNGN